MDDVQKIFQKVKNVLKAKRKSNQSHLTKVFGYDTRGTSYNKHDLDNEIKNHNNEKNNEQQSKIRPCIKV